MKEQDKIQKYPLSQEFVFNQGNEVGEVARNEFKDGVLIKNYPLKEAVKDTKKALDGGAKNIFEAAFEHEGVHVKVDILKRLKNDTFDIIEVKQTTRFKDKYAPDMAIQRYVVEGSGQKVRKVYLMHLNKAFIYLSTGDLFELHDSTDVVNNHLLQVSDNLKKQFERLEQDKPPKVQIGPHCTDPYDCPLMDECWADIPEKSVFTLPGRNKMRWELFDKGIIDLKDLPNDFKANKTQKRYLDALKRGAPIIDKEAIKGLLAVLREPIYFLDFETIMWALPRYEGTHPFDTIPFQWSLHVLKDDHLEHKEFLWDNINDPRPKLIESLLEAVGDHGSIMMFTKYEETVLKGLSKFAPKHEKAIYEVIKRLWDLNPIFKYHYIHPDMEGRSSLKCVLPAVCPHLSYDNMDVANGSDASATFAMIIQSEGEEKEAYRKALLEYCCLDTLALVELYKIVKRDVG